MSESSYSVYLIDGVIYVPQRLLEDANRRIAKLETAIRTHCADRVQEGYEMPYVLTSAFAAPAAEGTE